jgi:hypothetical protein
VTSSLLRTDLVRRLPAVLALLATVLVGVGQWSSGTDAAPRTYSDDLVAQHAHERVLGSPANVASRATQDEDLVREVWLVASKGRFRLGAENPASGARFVVDSGGTATDLTRSSFNSYYDTAGTLDASTGANEATFYSGEGNRALAEQFAEENGGSTLEMTPGGKWLDQEGSFDPTSPLTRGEAVAVWSRLSGRFAPGASGTPFGFVQGASPYGVWATTELPALESNPAITNIIAALTGGG